MCYLLNAVVLVCCYLFMCCYSYLMMKITYAVPSYIIKGGELITVNTLDGEKNYFRTRHNLDNGRVDISDNCS
jgi:hypothetical protein